MVTVSQAFRNGADHIVVGRPIRDADSPRAAAESIQATIAQRRSDLEARSRVWDAVIRSRALVLDEIATRHQTTRNSADPEMAALWESLSGARSELADLAVRGPDIVNAGAYAAEFDQLRRVKERAEHLLARKSDRFRTEQARSRIGFAEVARNLPPNSALVAFVLYPLDTAGSQASPGAREFFYRVFVLRQGVGNPRSRRLGHRRRSTLWSPGGGRRSSWTDAIATFTGGGGERIPADWRGTATDDLGSDRP